MEENTEQIKFSKFLVTIKTDVPVELDLNSLRTTPPNNDALRSIYEELEFRAFLKKMENNSNEMQKT